MEYIVRMADQLEALLRAFRKKRGLSQLELARKIGVTQQAFSLLEAAPNRASFERLQSVFSALDIEVVLREKDELPASPPDQW